MKVYLEMIISFMRVGAFTFGGGYAMLPLLQREVVNKRKWCSDDELMDYFAIGQCTPGIIAINVATFIGYRKKGLLGAIVATLSIVFPSLVIILSIASLLTSFQDIPIIQNALSGIRIAVCILILNALIKLGKNVFNNKLGIILFSSALILAYFSILPTIIIIIISALIGILLPLFKKGKEVKS